MRSQSGHTPARRYSGANPLDTPKAALFPNRAAQTARDAKEHRRETEEMRRREQLHLRIRTTLDDTARVRHQFMSNPPDSAFETAPTNVLASDGVAAVRSRSDDLRLLDDPELEKKFDGLMAGTRTLAEQARYGDENIASDLMEYQIAPGHFPAQGSSMLAIIGRRLRNSLESSIPARPNRLMSSTAHGRLHLPQSSDLHSTQSASSRESPRSAFPEIAGVLRSTCSLCGSGHLAATAPVSELLAGRALAIRGPAERL